MPDRPLGAGDQVVISGASGLLGTALTAALTGAGIRVRRLVRRASTSPDEVQWTPGHERLDPGVLAGARAVICLNGASIGRLPWTSRYRSELLWSRLTPTRTIADAVARLNTDAPQFVTASGVNFYGAHPSGPVDEESPAGAGFLADLCQAWEEATAPASANTTVTHLRFAPVIHKDGVLKPLIVLTRLGLGGPLGSGTQTAPWVGFEDALGAIRHTVANTIAGPVNVVGPTRASSNDLGFALAMQMQRPYLLRAPAWALRMLLSEAADELLLDDLDVTPAVLERTGYRFSATTVQDAIATALPR